MLLYDLNLREYKKTTAKETEMTKISIKFYGTCGSFPVTADDRRVFGGNTSCILFSFGQTKIMLDAGSGANAAMRELGGEKHLDLLISHPHLDHISGIVSLIPSFGGRELDIHGKTRDGMTVSDICFGLMGKPFWPVSPDLFPGIRFFDVPESFELGGVKIGTLESNHPGGSTAFRFSYGGKTVVSAIDFNHADGYGEKVRVRPFGVLYKSLRAGERVALDSGSFWFRSDGLSSLLLTEGRTGFCGGVVRVYALHLDLEHLNAGFTLYLDDLQTGEILALLPGVEGSATGTVHGKIPLSWRDGRAFLRDAYLYSPPGQIGKLRLTETDAVVENLRAAGVPDSTCDDLGRALANLDYTVLRMDLRQNRDGTGRLDVKLEGSATEENLTIPVSLDLGFNGQIQDLLNVGIRASALGGN